MRLQRSRAQVPGLRLWSSPRPCSARVLARPTCSISLGNRGFCSGHHHVCIAAAIGAAVLRGGTARPQTCAAAEASPRSSQGEQRPPRAAPSSNPLAELAGLFGGDEPEERDPITPFTLYGTTFKKYLIEELDGEKIVARKKGFTVQSCVGAVGENKESPQFQGLPTGDKALYADERVCSKAEGQDLKQTCRTSCETSCSKAIDSYAAQITDESGFRLLPKDRERLQKSCTRNCAYECSKPGKAFDFVIPYRK